MSYSNHYRNKVQEVMGEKPGDLITVILNENSPIGSKLQYCARLPEHTEIDPYNDRTELDEEYDRRTTPNQFRRVEQTGLLGHLPKYSTKKMHHPMVNPDIRLRLIEAAKDDFSPFEVAGLEKSDDIEQLDLDLGPELDIFSWMRNIGDRATEAMIWYVGRAIDTDSLPDPRSSGFSKFGLQTYLFGQIAIFIEDWENADPDLTFTEFGTRKGETKDGYKIMGEFTADPMELKTDLDISVPVETTLKDWIRGNLITLFKYSMFEPADVDDADVRNGHIELGDGTLPFKDLTAAQTGEYEDADPDDIEDWGTRQLVNRLTFDVTIDQNTIEFDLHLHETPTES